MSEKYQIFGDGRRVAEGLGISIDPSMLSATAQPVSI